MSKQTQEAEPKTEAKVEVETPKAEAPKTEKTELCENCGVEIMPIVQPPLDVKAEIAKANEILKSRGVL